MNWWFNHQPHNSRTHEAVQEGTMTWRARQTQPTLTCIRNEGLTNSQYSACSQWSKSRPTFELTEWSCEAWNVYSPKKINDTGYLSTEVEFQYWRNDHPFWWEITSGDEKLMMSIFIWWNIQVICGAIHKSIIELIENTNTVQLYAVNNTLLTSRGKSRCRISLLLSLFHAGDDNLKISKFQFQLLQQFISPGNMGPTRKLLDVSVSI